VVRVLSFVYSILAKQEWVSLCLYSKSKTMQEDLCPSCARPKSLQLSRLTTRQQPATVVADYDCRM
jgi:hypothetical protein